MTLRQELFNKNKNKMYNKICLGKAFTIPQLAIRDRRVLEFLYHNVFMSFLSNFYLAAFWCLWRLSQLFVNFFSLKSKALLFLIIIIIINFVERCHQETNKNTNSNIPDTSAGLVEREPIQFEQLEKVH